MYYEMNFIVGSLLRTKLNRFKHFQIKSNEVIYSVKDGYLFKVKVIETEFKFRLLKLGV